MKRTARAWQPVDHVLLFGCDVTFPAACRCDRRLTRPHTDQSCPYIEPDLWYAAEAERMSQRSPA